MNELKFAIRQLVKNSGFTVVAVLTCALGIGAHTALSINYKFLNSSSVKPACLRIARNVPIGTSDVCMAT